jgi:hypothetical protein
MKLKIFIFLSQFFFITNQSIVKQFSFTHEKIDKIKPTWKFTQTNNLSTKKEFNIDFEQYENAEQEKYLNELLKNLKRKKPQRVLFEGLEITPSPNYRINYTKEWTILIYIAGDNDLYRFAIRNLQQLLQLGSSDLLNIVVHFDFHHRGKPKETRRFFVKRNELLQIEHWIFQSYLSSL